MQGARTSKSKAKRTTLLTLDALTKTNGNPGKKGFSWLAFLLCSVYCLQACGCKSHVHFLQIEENDLSANIGVGELVSSLKDIGHKVLQSEDPGRFVCNWVYFHSLHQSRVRNTANHNVSEATAVDSAKSPPKFISLFVHVPTFEVITCEQQLAFVRDLLSQLTNKLVFPP